MSYEATWGWSTERKALRKVNAQNVQEARRSSMAEVGVSEPDIERK